MSLRTKENLKRGAISLAIVVSVGLFLVGGSFAYTTLVSGKTEAKVEGLQTEVSKQASTLQSIKIDTCWIKGRLNGEKFPNCPIPTN